MPETTRTGQRLAEPSSVMRRVFYWANLIFGLALVGLSVRINLYARESGWTDYALTALSVWVACHSLQRLVPSKHWSRPWLSTLSYVALAFTAAGLIAKLLEELR